MAEGYKDWSAGDILTAADLEDYTVKQSVMVFADASARTSALSSVLREGMVSYLKDTDSTEVYDGSAWAAVGGAGGLVPLATSTFSSVASVTIDNVFSAEYRNYKIMFRLESCSATMSTRFRFRSAGADITSNMHQQRLYAFSSTVGTSTNPAGTTEWWMSDSAPTYADRAKWELTLFDPYESKDAQALLLGGYENTATVLHVSTFFHNATTSCDGLKVFPSTGTFGGTINVYGLVDPT